MALTISGYANTAFGTAQAPILTSQAIRYVTITGDSSYPSGGYSVTTSVISQMGFLQFLLGTLPIYTVAGGYAIMYDAVSKTLRWLTIPGSTAAAVEATAGANLSAITVQTAVMGA